MENAVDNVDQMAEADNKLELGLDIDDGKVDLLDGEGDAGVDGNETGDIGIKVDVGLQVVHIEFDTAHGEIRHIQKHVRRRRR